MFYKHWILKSWYFCERFINALFSNSLFANPLALHKLGILGMNERNSRYISQYNSRRLYPLVDDKLQTKKLLEGSDINVPELIGTIEEQSEVEKLLSFLPISGGFVIKPAKGSGGKGILVIQRSLQDAYTKANGQIVDLVYLKRHCSNILAGLYSLGGKADVAIIESIIQFDETFSDFSYEGVPDIRVIVFKGYPVMAMIRLSTKASDGKANLHQGAVGVGLHISTGQALHAVQFDKPVDRHPDTQHLLTQLHVPDWPNLLLLAAQCYDETQLGYLGADIVLDVEKGPLLLELNARPGLAIQIANGCGLKPRLQLIEKQRSVLNAEQRVAFCQTEMAKIS